MRPNLVENACAEGVSAIFIEARKNLAVVGIVIEMLNRGAKSNRTTWSPFKLGIGRSAIGNNVAMKCGAVAAC